MRKKDDEENLVTVERCCLTSNVSSSALKLENRNKKNIRRIIGITVLISSLLSFIQVGVYINNTRKHQETAQEN